MSHVTKAAGLLAMLLAMLLSLGGCAAKKPINFQFTACKVVNSYVDRDGNQRRDCNCKNGKQIGWDAKEHLAIIRCE